MIAHESSRESKLDIFRYERTHAHLQRPPLANSTTEVTVNM